MSFRRVGYSLIFALFFLCSCASNTVRLVYSSPGDSTPANPAPQVGVVMFIDSRLLSEIGKRSDGSAFIPSSEVRDWFSRELVAELNRQGVGAVFFNDEDAARASNIKYMVKGSIDEIQLIEHSSTSYSCSMRASVTMLKGSTPVLNTGFNSSVSKRVVPYSSVPQEVLSETQQELVKNMAEAIRKSIR